MPFPITLDSVVYDNPRRLATEVMRRATAGEPVELALAQAASTGALSQDEVVGLCAALIQTGQPAAVATGARLAAKLNDPALCPLLLLAHEALDVGTLLSATHDNRSVEDALLTAAADIFDGDDDRRRSLLMCLRNAGLGTSETRLLARYATAAEIRHALPGVLLEGLPSGTADDIAVGLTRGDDIAQALIDAVGRLTASAREAIWQALTQRAPQQATPDLQARLQASR